MHDSLQVCQDTIIGSSMNRGISGGQKKRVTIGMPCAVCNADDCFRHGHNLISPSTLLPPASASPPAHPLCQGPLSPPIGIKLPSGIFYRWKLRRPLWTHLTFRPRKLQHDQSASNCLMLSRGRHGIVTVCGHVGGSGEMLVGPRAALFMDEVSSGLDSSTNYLIVKCLRNLSHLTEVEQMGFCHRATSNSSAIEDIDIL